MCQGLPTIRDYKGKHSREQPDELNNFYARFEASNTETCMSASAVLDDCVFTLSAADVIPLNRSTFTRPHSQTDYQDVYSEHALTNWQVSSQTFFNLSLTESVIPTCFKQTTIVPVPKITKVNCLNDYRPVALMSVAMKCFERLVMAHINTVILETLDPHQFAYHSNIHR
jgi:hypothetical protein